MGFVCPGPQQHGRPYSIFGTKPTYGSQHSKGVCLIPGHRQELLAPAVNKNLQTEGYSETQLMFERRPLAAIPRLEDNSSSEFLGTQQLLETQGPRPTTATTSTE